jgi:tRNA C32,U32 (ribose-2'-O)-methylase TrmJ
VQVVLVNPFLDRNVGSVARSMLNFGRGRKSHIILIKYTSTKYQRDSHPLVGHHVVRLVF